MEECFDVVVIGGGINGCGCAADAALRGLSVLLCEKDDLASKTSSCSTKLIHGGLRYLEHYDFRMVRKALNERQRLLELAPHLVHPLPLILPLRANARPAWLIRLGLFLYDHLSNKNRLPKSRLITRLQKHRFFEPLKPLFSTGFQFYDGATDDARLTITNALQAEEHGARILTRTRLVHATPLPDGWLLTLQTKNHSEFQIRAKTLVNAGGPWVKPLSELIDVPIFYPMTLVKGSHLVVQQIYEGDHAYVLQHHDQRIVFVIPYHGYTLIGTTDVAFSSDPDHICIDDHEIDYLLELINQYFEKKTSKEQIITTFSGVRTLLADSNKALKKLSRDYTYHFSSDPAPNVTIYGGKITTFRQLAKEVIDSLQPVFPEMRASITATIPLPGAIFEKMNFEDYQTFAYKKYDWLPVKILNHYLQLYGTRTERILQNCQSVSELGFPFTEVLHEIEVNYLIWEEWALNSDDILWRRTKEGLHIQPAALEKLNSFIQFKLLDKKQYLFA